MTGAIAKILGKVSRGLKAVETPTAGLERPLQLLLSLGWRERAEAGRAPLDFDDVSFDTYSATGEDGILLYIFSLIGFGSRRCVDIGAGGVQGSNACNLIVHHGFSALLVDADPRAVEAAKRFYGARSVTSNPTPVIHEGFVSAEDADSILERHGFAGELDLLCIDVDGVDWWLWKAIGAANPRVVVVEYQNILGPHRSCTIPYSASFRVSDYAVNRTHYNYCGASLRAFTKLGAEKGYRLVGCNRGGWNAFFVKRGVFDERLPEVSIESCFRYPWNRFGMEHRFPLVRDMEWVET